jgi:cytoskeletal protein CcmA (bactofilin family)
MSRSLFLLILLAVAPLAASASDATNDEGIEQSVGGDHFAAGRAVSLDGSIAGDAFAAGGEVTVDGPITGDAYLTGAHVEMRGSVGQGLYAAGALVAVSGRVKHDARLVGGTVEVSPAARFGGALSMAGRTLSMAGITDGNLRMVGRDVTVSGGVGGDAEISAAHIEIGPSARIAGKLRYRSEREPAIADGAQIGGGLERLPGTYRAWTWREGSHDGIDGTGRGAWLGGSFVFGVLLLLLAPDFLRGTSRIAASEWPLSLGVGMAMLVAVPFVAVLLLITLIGIPVALLAIALYALLLLLGHIVAVVAVGDYALGRWAPARAQSAGWRVLGLLGALVALGVARHVPLVGGLVTLLVLLTGIGALSLYVVRPKPAAASA